MSNMTDLWLSDVFFQALNTPKLVFDWLFLHGWGGGHLATPMANLYIVWCVYSANKWLCWWRWSTVARELTNTTATNQYLIRIVPSLS